jgi:hypothetical protein
MRRPLLTGMNFLVATEEGRGQRIMLLVGSEQGCDVCVYVYVFGDEVLEPQCFRNSNQSY